MSSATLEPACRLYDGDLETILPSRVPVLIDKFAMSAGGLRVTFVGSDPTAVLKGYLRLIRAIRDQRHAPAIALRRDDIERIAAYLDLDDDLVVDRLAALMGATPTQRVAIGALFAAGAIMVGLVLAGQVHADEMTATDATVDVVTDSVAAPVTSVEVVDTEPIASLMTSPPPATTAPDFAVEVPTTVVTDRSHFADVSESVVSSTTVAIDAITGPADSDGLAPAVRVQVPAATPPAVIAPTVTENQSGCRTDPGAVVMSLTIPDISYECPVYSGGQSQIDAGFVTLVTDAGPNAVLATRPGEPGTLWLAGHRTSHGAAFADVPHLVDGALITVAANGGTATYRVVGRTYVEVRNDRVVDADGNPTALATWESIIRSDQGGNLAPRLVLQTCEGANFRWMIYADLVTG